MLSQLFIQRGDNRKSEANKSRHGKPIRNYSLKLRNTTEKIRTFKNTKENFNFTFIYHH